MSLTNITKYTLNKQQYLSAIRQIIKLLNMGEEDERQLREVAPENEEKIASFFDPTIPAGCFYEDSFFEHVCVFNGLAGLSERFNTIIQNGELFITDFSSMEVEPPHWFETQEGESRKSLMFAGLYTLIKSINAIKATSWPINHFISQGRKGDRSALQHAVKLDTVAITCPTVVAEIMKSEFLDKGKFRRQLNNALRYPHKIDRVQHGSLRFILRTMNDDGMLARLNDEERFQFFCIEERLYPNQNDDVPQVSRSPRLGEMMNLEVRKWQEGVLPASLN